MIPFKAKVEKTEMASPGEIQELKGTVGKGYAVDVQAIFYSSTNPGFNLHLFDADGDEFIHPIPGQRAPQIVVLDTPISVKLPIMYTDTGMEGNEILILGKAERITQVASGF